MKLLSRISPLLAVLLLVGCAQNPPAAQSAAKPAAPSLAPAGAGFTADMPGTPQEKVAANNNHVFASEVNGLAYIISYTDMPPQVSVTPQTVPALLDATRNGVVRNGRAKLLKEDRTTLDGEPARDLRLKTKEGYFMRLKLAFRGSRLYQVGVVAPQDSAAAPEIQRFLDSFHFTAQK